MSTRTRALAPLWTILVVGAALLVAAAPVAAKEGVQAQLTTTIPRDATPGSTLLVEWDAFMPSPVRRDPIMGSPVFIRLLPAGAGKATEARGFEKPSGSGHYAAEVVVPASGIDGVQIGLVGEMCTAGSACVRDDIMLLLVGPVMTTVLGPGGREGRRRGRGPDGGSSGSRGDRSTAGDDAGGRTGARDHVVRHRTGMAGRQRRGDPGGRGAARRRAAPPPPGRGPSALDQVGGHPTKEVA